MLLMKLFPIRILIMNRFRLTIFILYLLVANTLLLAQSPNEIDSLERINEETNDLRKKIDVVGKLIEAYSYTKPANALNLLQSSLRQAKEEGYLRGEYRIYYEYANFYNVNAKYDSAIYYANKSLEIVEILKDSTLYSVPNLHLAWSYSILGDYKAARKATLRTLEISENIGDWSSLAESYFGVGNLYFYESNLPKALEAYLKTDSILQKMDPNNMTLVNTNVNIAQLLITDKKYDKAPYYLDKSEKVAKNNEHDFSLATVELMRGILHTKAENYEKAFPHLKKAEEFFNNFHSEFDLAETNYYLGQYYYNIKKYDLATSYHHKSVELHRKVEDPMGVANSYFTLGLIHADQGMYNQAIKYVEQAHDLYDEASIEQKVECLSRLSEMYAQSNEFEKAYEIAKEYNSLRDTLIVRQNSEVLNDLETKYQTEKKEQEIALLSSQNDVINQQKENQRNMLLGGLGITTLAGMFLFLLLRNRQKTNKKLRELDSLKSNFFANISHEFRTPLTLITGPLEKRLESGKLSKQDRQELEMMQRNSNRLLVLVDQLLDLSKLESGKFQIRVRPGDLGNLIRAIGESFQFKAGQQKIDYSLRVEALEDAWFDKDVIEKILTNLLSNAFKYTETGGEVSVTAKRMNHHMVLETTNGPTLSKPASTDKLFDRFYQSDSHREGVGIGLSLVKELAILNHGDVSIRQSEARELCLVVQLPISKEAFDEREILREIDDTVENRLSDIVPLPETEDPNREIMPEKEDERAIVLVVEDNKDVRLLIKDALRDKFKIIEAGDGNSGIETAINWVPDLIVSDIMMPGTNGIELCQTLKNDERTSHIPIVLLTAKAGEEDQYEGLSSGADAYVTKPFKIKLLKTRIEKLIESRKLLRDRYSQEVILKPKDIAITDVDEQFLGRVQEVMEAKLTSSQFNAKEFSEAVGMSRMQLHRKLKALTGLSATEFVRSQRLKLAASLLRSSNASVSDIGYQVGFNDPSYFTRCFKEAYGCSPTEYNQKQTT